MRNNMDDPPAMDMDEDMDFGDEDVDMDFGDEEPADIAPPPPTMECERLP